MFFFMITANYKNRAKIRKRKKNPNKLKIIQLITFVLHQSYIYL